MKYQNYLNKLTYFLNNSHDKSFLSNFLTALTNEKNITTEEKFKLISFFILTTLTFDDISVIEQYLYLLKKILIESPNTISSIEIYTLLSTRTTDGCTVGNFIAWQAPKLIPFYISLLYQLQEKKKLTVEHIHALQRIQTLVVRLAMHDESAKIISITSHTFAACLLNPARSFSVTYKNPIVFYFLQLIDNHLLPYDDYRHLLEQKNNICDYIVNLSDSSGQKKQIKSNLLQHALNPQHSLGVFFATARGDWATNYHSGTLKQLTEAFLILHQFHQPERLYQFLYIYNRNFTTTFNLSYDVLLSQKTLLCDYLCDDTKWPEKTDERIKAIQTALHPHSPLGEFIWHKRERGTPTKTNGSRAKLIEKLLLLLPDADLSFIPDILIKSTNNQLQTINPISLVNHHTDFEKLQAHWDTINTQNLSDVAIFLASLTNSIDSDGYNLWHKIASTPNKSLNKAYLKLILNILEKCPTMTYEIFNLLNICTSAGWTIGNLLVANQSGNIINLYLDVLLKLKEYNFPLHLLNTLTEKIVIKKIHEITEVNTFTDYLSKNTTKNTSAVILRFLFNNFLFINKSLLTRKEDIRDFLLTFDTASSEKKRLILDILKKIFTEGTKLNEYFLTKRGTLEPTYDSGTLNPLKNKFLTIMGLTDPQKLYQTLITDNYPYPYEILSEQKEILFIYILSLPTEEERKNAIENALKKDHPLGKLFWLQRGNTLPRKNRGVLGKLLDAYQHFDIWNDQKYIQSLLLDIQENTHFDINFSDELIKNRNNIRNYIFTLDNSVEKLRLLENSLNPSTALGRFFRENILTPASSPRLLYLFKALLYFATISTPKETKIYLASPFDEIYRSQVSPTSSNSVSFWKAPNKNTHELSNMVSHTHQTWQTIESKSEEEILYEEEFTEENYSTEDMDDLGFYKSILSMKAP